MLVDWSRELDVGGGHETGGGIVSIARLCSDVAALGVSGKRRWLSLTEASSGRCLSREKAPSTATKVISPGEGKSPLLGLICPKAVHLYDGREGLAEAVHVFRPSLAASHPLASAALHVDGFLLAAGTEPREEEEEAFLAFFDLRTCGGSGDSPLLGVYSESHSAAVRSLVFDATTSRLLSGGDDGLVNVFDVSAASEEDALLYTFNAEAEVAAATWLWHGLAGAVTEDGRGWAWETMEGDEIGRVETDKVESASLHLVTMLAIGDEPFALASTGSGGPLRLLPSRGNPKSPKSETKLSGGAAEHDDLVRCAVFDAEKKLLLTAGDDSRLIATKLAL